MTTENTHAFEESGTEAEPASSHSYNGAESKHVLASSTINISGLPNTIGWCFKSRRGVCSIVTTSVYRVEVCNNRINNC